MPKLLKVLIIITISDVTFGFPVASLLVTTAHAGGWLILDAGASRPKGPKRHDSGGAAADALKALQNMPLESFRRKPESITI